MQYTSQLYKALYYKVFQIVERTMLSKLNCKSKELPYQGFEEIDPTQDLKKLLLFSWKCWMTYT